MKRTITEIHYNWWYLTSEGCDFISKKVGEIYEDKILNEITEHGAQGEGDKWFYDLNYADGSMERVFNPNRVFYKN